jgi:dipeptidyl-peptidase-4
VEKERMQAGLGAREEMYRRYLNIERLILGGEVEPHWMADGDAFWYAEGAPDETVIYKVDPEAKTKTPLFDTSQLRRALADALGHKPPYEGLPFQDFEFVEDESAIVFAVEGRKFRCRLEDYAIEALPTPTEEEKVRTTPRRVRKGKYAGAPDVMEVRSPDGSWFAGGEDHNVYLRSTYDGRKQPLTDDGVEEYGWDLEGAQWSPDSRKLAVLKLDNRGVLKMPIVHWLKPTEEVEWVYYTKAGGPMTQTELHIIDALSRRAVRVETGEELDQIIHPVGWRFDGSEFLFYRIDRAWKRLDLMAADPRTGAARVVVTEAQDTFVLGLEFSRVELLTLLKDNGRFIWRSERDGWAHFYLYDLQGDLIHRLTEGEFPVERVLAVDEEAGWVYFTAHAEKRPYDTHLYCVNLEGNGFARLTEGIGQHEVQFSPSKKFFLDTHSSIDRPPVVELRRADGELLDTLSEADITALEGLKWHPPEEFVVKAADGETDLYGVMIKPYDFDSEKKYPVLDYIYNGPQTTWVPRTFRPSTWPRLGEHALALAQLGFILFVVDGRGTIQRGKAFQDVAYGNFGRNEIPDHVAALKQLAEDRPYMDLERVGIFGRSWGGYMTVRAMVTASDVYHVGIANNPVVDLYDHMASAIEPYMGLRQNDPEGYEYASSRRLAGNLTGKLLLVHGTSDVNATFSATMKMVEALTRAGKPYDLMVVPDQDHHFDGASERYWRDSLCRYFEEHLKP